MIFSSLYGEPHERGSFKRANLLIFLRTAMCSPKKITFFSVETFTEILKNTERGRREDDSLRPRKALG